MLSVQQTIDENRDEFLARLMEAGWSKSDALKEWNDIQADEEGEV